MIRHWMGGELARGTQRGAAQLTVYLVLAAVLLGLAVGAWGGVRWQQGATAVRDNAHLRADLEQMRAAAADLRKAQAQLVEEYTAAVARQNAIAEQLEQDREQNRDHYERQRAGLEALLERRPDLSSGAGADVLCHWRRANAGPTAGSAAAGPECDPDAELPRPAAAAGRSLGHADRKPRRHRGAVPRLPRSSAAVAGSSAGVAGHRVGLVLQQPGSLRRRFGDMRK